MGGDRLELMKKCDGDVDRISNLADEILVSIVSLLSLKQAVSSSGISSRWSDLWKHIPTLNLDLRILAKRGRIFEFPKQLFIEWVSSVCDSHDAASLKRLRIHGNVENSEQHAVTTWLEHAASCKRLESLELEMTCYSPERRVALDEEVLLRVNFNCLKELSLVEFTVSGAAVKVLLQNSPVLERLRVQKSRLASDVEVRSRSLRHLDTMYCHGERSITVAAPNLAFLRGNRTSDLLLLENVPRLLEADFSFTTQWDGSVQRFGLALFACFSQLHTLTLHLHSPKAYLASEFPEMPKLKKLKVIYAGKFEEGLIPMTSFIRASPFLVEFHLEVVSR